MKRDVAMRMEPDPADATASMYGLWTRYPVGSNGKEKGVTTRARKAETTTSLVRLATADSEGPH
jgi:hypothetical protein